MDDDLTRLALAAGGGDQVALEAFVRRAQRVVWRLHAHLVDRASADDLTQDTFVRAMRALGSYRGDSPAQTWLLSIARRAAADEIRSRQRRRRLLGRIERRHDAEPDHAGWCAGNDLIVEILDPDRRVAFVLTQLLGLTYAETAEVCDCEVGTIRSRVARARSQLIDALEISKATA